MLCQYWRSNSWRANSKHPSHAMASHPGGLCHRSWLDLHGQTALLNHAHTNRYSNKHGHNNDNHDKDCKSPQHLRYLALLGCAELDFWSCVALPAIDMAVADRRRFVHCTYSGVFPAHYSHESFSAPMRRRNFALSAEESKELCSHDVLR